MSIQFQFSTNPQTNSKPSDEKIAQLKEQQKERRAELYSYVEKYTAAYKASEKECAHTQSIFLMRERELKRHNESEKDYARYEKEYRQAKKAYQSATFDKDLRLQLLQYRNDSYIKACRINLIDLA